MKTVLKTVLGLTSLAMLGAGQAFAVETSQQTVPEIDAGQGLAALAILLCVGLILREKFFRETPAKS